MQRKTVRVRDRGFFGRVQNFLWGPNTETIVTEYVAPHAENKECLITRNEAKELKNLENSNPVNERGVFGNL